MKCNGKDQVPVEKRGLLGFRKAVTEIRTANADSKRDRDKKMKNKPNSNNIYSVEEMLFYDDIICDD